MENTQIHYVEGIEDVNEYYRWLGNRRNWLAFDTETGGLEPWKQPLRLVQVGDTEEAWVFRADRWLGVIDETLPKYDGPMVGQNVGFDWRFLKTQGNIELSWSNLNDTKVMAHILDPTKSTSLKSLGAKFLSPKAKKLQGTLAAAMVAQGWGWGDIPFDYPIYWGYAGIDCILTARIAEEFWPKIETEFKNVYELEMEVTRICSNMEMKGVAIDLPYCEEMYEKLTTYCNTVERWCVDNYHVRPSEAQKVAIRLSEEGVDLSKTTASGLWAMDKDVLEGLAHPLAEAVLNHRKSTKIASTYFRDFLETHDNGIIHPSINTLGARTGRMSGRLMVLPRGSVVRDAFLPRPGYGWVSADYDAVEMRLLAHFSQDQAMISAIQDSDVDIHTAMARLMYQDDTIDKKSHLRSMMKNGNFAKVYGAGAEKLSITAGVSLEFVEQFLDVYDTRFPGVRDFMKKVERTAKYRLDLEGQGYVKSPIGRRHTAEKNKFYTLTNYLIQGSAADVFKQSLIDLDLAGLGDYLLLPVHDEADFEIPSDEVKTLIPQIEEIMTQKNWTIPLTVSAEGPFNRWGEKYN